MICKWIFLSQQFLHEPWLICLPTVKWFQVLLSNTNSFIFTQLNYFQYCKWLNSSVWPIVTTVITIPGQSGPRSNGNEWKLHIPQRSRTWASLSDDFVIFRTLIGLRFLLLSRKALGDFYNPSLAEWAFSA